MSDIKPTPTHTLPEGKKAFQKALQVWFTEHAEDYPWRRTTDPYQILVSEVMLQQTTIQAVVENKRFERFLEQFPDMEALAIASESDILRAWEGLGYYNRVRNLQKTAQAVLGDYNGSFPETLAELQKLPGVGPYTAAAIATFAFGIPAPLVDANVARLFARLYNDEKPVNAPAGQKWAWSQAAELMPDSAVAAYNAGLMELGQKVCKNKEVHCQLCPVSAFCQCPTPLTLPLKLKKQKAIELAEHALWVQRENGDLLMEKEEGQRRKGLWKLPPVPADATALLVKLSTSQYAITKYKVTLHIYEGEVTEKDAIEAHQQWVSPATLITLPLPSPLRKVVNALGQRLL